MPCGPERTRPRKPLGEALKAPLPSGGKTLQTRRGARAYGKRSPTFPRLTRRRFRERVFHVLRGLLCACVTSVSRCFPRVSPPRGGNPGAFREAGAARVGAAGEPRQDGRAPAGAAVGRGLGEGGWGRPRGGTAGRGASVKWGPRASGAAASAGLREGGVSFGSRWSRV